METGDRVLILLGAKIACCVLMALAAVGALGGLGLSLTDGLGRWLVAGVIAALIAWVVFARRRRPAANRSRE